jgi:hypothetical protein
MGAQALGDDSETFVGRRQAEALAVFLKANATHWRIRRHDKFVPFDFHLAEHQITLQGRIDNALLERFAGTNSTDDADSFELEPGSPLALYLPAISQRKELLVDFSTRDESGRSLPILARMEGSQISAAYALAALSNGEMRTRRTDLTPAEVLAASVVLTLVAYINPYSLVVRVRDWGRECGFRLEKAAPLRGDALEAWIYSEAELFLSGAGDHLVERLEPLLARQAGGENETVLPDAIRRGGIEHFPWLSSVLLHGARDLLRLTVEFAPAWRADGSAEPIRGELMDDPAALVSAAAEYASVGLDTIERLVQNQEQGRRSAATEEMFRMLPRWTAYTACTVRVGFPFLIKIHEVLPLHPRVSTLKVWLRAIATKIDVPIPFKDAAALHVEVVLKDPELKLGKGLTVTDETDSLRPRENATHYFGTISRASDQVAQLYSSRRDGETAERDVFPARLRFYVKLTLSILIGYWLTALALSAAAVFVSREWFALLFRDEPLEASSVSTVMALAVTVSLWLVGVSHRRPIVHRKLILPRILFAVTVAVMLSWPLIWLVKGIVDGRAHKPDGKPAVPVSVRYLAPLDAAPFVLPR